ncbi:ArdC family protein [Stratiformator vulcanicus]|uniref:DNA primase TraC n=1 Tax=Stratiformator vulcanicus TaxID=2527980 RepID=A0A517R1F8_9PLAN|nr:zincin-like metallopeptidase domain-containing protein [Stratiformator vulcanicus]QDT37680.1 DNA primase TraC [Stratiformator vulcanicus]
MADVYQLITDRIIELLEQGTVPWHKPWRSAEHAPQNLISRKAYRGINAFLLGCLGYESPYWLTFKQAKQLGGVVRKGEKSVPVVFWKWLEKRDPQTDEIERLPLLKYYRVFHVTQCDLPGAKVPVVEEPEEAEFEPILACEQVVENMPNAPKIEIGGGRACYAPKADVIKMPKCEVFETAEDYYATLFHELTHATGHTTRLDRDGVRELSPFGSASYSKEELVAEVGAAFLCGHCGIDTATIENTAAYVDGWLKKLRGDKKLVVQAAAQAQKAADYVLGVTFKVNDE